MFKLWDDHIWSWYRHRPSCGDCSETLVSFNWRSNMLSVSDSWGRWARVLPVPAWGSSWMNEAHIEMKNEANNSREADESNEYARLCECQVLPMSGHANARWRKSRKMPMPPMPVLCKDDVGRYHLSEPRSVTWLGRPISPTFQVSIARSFISLYQVWWVTWHSFRSFHLSRDWMWGQRGNPSLICFNKIIRLSNLCSCMSLHVLYCRVWVIVFILSIGSCAPGHRSRLRRVWPCLEMVVNRTIWRVVSSIDRGSSGNSA
jgi:hypothetical protein